MSNPKNLLEKKYCVIGSAEHRGCLKSIIYGTNTLNSTFLFSKKNYIEIKFLENCLVHDIEIIFTTIPFSNHHFVQYYICYSVKIECLSEVLHYWDSCGCEKDYSKKFNKFVQKNEVLRIVYNPDREIIGENKIFDTTSYGIMSISINGSVDNYVKGVKMLKKYPFKYLTIKTNNGKIDCFRSFFSAINISKQTNVIEFPDFELETSEFLDYMFDLKKIPASKLLVIYLLLKSLKMFEHLFVICKMVENVYSLNECFEIFCKSLVLMEDLERLGKGNFKSPLNMAIFNIFKKNQEEILKLESTIGLFLEKMMLLRCFLSYSRQIIRDHEIFINIVSFNSFRGIYDSVIDKLYRDVNYSTMKLKCENYLFDVHYEILVLRSEFFRKLLFKGKERKQLLEEGIVSMEEFGLSQEELEIYLCFVYKRKIKKNVKFCVLLKVLNIGEMLNEEMFIDLVLQEIVILTEKLKKRGHLSIEIKQHGYLLQSDEMRRRFVEELDGRNSILKEKSLKWILESRFKRSFDEIEKRLVEKIGDQILKPPSNLNEIIKLEVNRLRNLYKLLMKKKNMNW